MVLPFSSITPQAKTPVKASSATMKMRIAPVRALRWRRRLRFWVARLAAETVLVAIVYSFVKEIQNSYPL